jgi:hypothetical protein
MKRILILFYSTLIISCGYAQNPNFIKYINSYKEEKPDNILNFAKVAQINRQMTKEDALEFVYDGDTAKLHCKQKIFNMETEKVEGISQELYLPSKCLRINMDNYFLIAYSSYLCQNPNELLKVVLNLSIVDRNFKIRDNMLVYKGSDYEAEITGLLNPNTGKVFLLGDIQNIKRKQAYIYKINNETLKFELIEEESNITGTTDNLTKLLDLLEWNETFMN